MGAKKAKTSLGKDEIRARLRDAGLRVTPGRLATYALLHEATIPLTHSEVSETLGDTGVDRATLFRNLQDLTEAGLVTRTDRGDHVWRFEVAGRHANHPHFVCVDCGEVACLPNVALQVTGDGVPRAVHQQRVEVQLRGRCDDCG